MKCIFFTLVCVWSLSLSALDIKGFKPSESVEYKETTKGALKLHYFLPEGHQKNDGKKRPAIVFFFGGGWNGGSPSQFYPFCQHLASKGMVAVSAQYRTKKSHGVDPKECIKDGKSAIRWVRKHAANYGIDPEMIAVGGGSAGGHVAASTGTATAFEEKSADKAISSWANLLVLYNPVLDNSEEGYGYSRVKDYWQEFSPMHNVTKKTPASIFLLGSKDKLIPVSTGEAWDAKLKSLGIDSELHIWEGQTHGFFNYGKSKGENGGKNFQEVVAKMDAFLKKYGYLK